MTRRRAAKAKLLALAALVLAAVAALTVMLIPERPDVFVGSKKFPESRLLGEIMAQLIEGRSELSVGRRFGLASNLCFTAIKAGEIDLYAEYTGTGLVVLLKEELGEKRDADTVYQRVKQQFAEKYNLLWLKPFGFYNTYAMVVRPEMGITRISELVDHQDTIRAGFNHAFLERSDGYPGLAAHYGLKIDDVGGVAHSQAYLAMEAGEIDLMEAYSTDGRLKKYKLVTLEDDRHFFPPYDAAPLLRKATADAHPEVVELLNSLAGRLTQERIVDLNYQIEVKGRSIRAVARDFLHDEGLTNSTGTDVAEQRGMTLVKLVPYLIDHLRLTLIATLAASVVGIFAGLAVARYPRALAAPVLGLAGVLQTVPSLALLALMLPIFGLGMNSAIVALFLYSLLPIIRNTYTGISSVPGNLKEAGTGMGMTRLELLTMLELPLATKTIMAGVRTALVICIGTATLAGFIRAGGLGELILTGLDMDDNRLVLWGAIPAALLALVADFFMSRLERLLEPKGLRLKQQSG